MRDEIFRQVLSVTHIPQALFCTSHNIANRKGQKNKACLPTILIQKPNFMITMKKMFYSKQEKLFRVLSYSPEASLRLPRTAWTGISPVCSCLSPCFQET